MPSWSFYAIGTPAPQGSKRHVGNGIMVEASKNLRPWRHTVTTAAYAAGVCLEGPVVVKMVFTMQRPKSARRIDIAPCKVPDLSKITRAVEDAITDAGLWSDDARVTEYMRLAKVWSGYDSEALPVPGVIVAAAERRGDWLSEIDEKFDQALTAAYVSRKDFVAPGYSEGLLL